LYDFICQECAEEFLSIEPVSLIREDKQVATLAVCGSHYGKNYSHGEFFQVEPVFLIREGKQAAAATVRGHIALRIIRRENFFRIRLVPSFEETSKYQHWQFVERISSNHFGCQSTFAVSLEYQVIHADGMLLW